MLEVSPFLNVLTKLFLNGLLFKIFATILSGYLYEKQFITTWNLLVNLDDEMRRFGNRVNYKKIRRCGSWVIIFQSIFKLTSSLTISIKYFNSHGLPTYYVYFIFVSSDVVVTSLKIAFVTKILLIYSYLSSINKTLITAKSKGSFLQSNSIIVAIKRSCQFYQVLCGVLKRVSAIYSLILVAFFVEAFILLVIHNYNMISQIMYKSEHTRTWELTKSFSIVWILESVATVLTIVLPAHCCAKMVSTKFNF